MTYSYMVGTPGILKFKSGEKMKHPMTVVVSSSSLVFIGSCLFRFNLKRKRHLVMQYLKKKSDYESDPDKPPRPEVDPDCLRWTPLVAENAFHNSEVTMNTNKSTTKIIKNC